MNVQTFEINREQAETLYRQYRDLPEGQRVPEDATMLKIYQRVRKGERIINVNKAFYATGLKPDGTPQLALARANWFEVYFFPRRHFRKLRGEWRTFIPGAGGFARIRTWNPGALRHNYALPEGTFNDEVLTRRVLRSPVPHIPPALRPKHRLEGYHILFEVERWEEYPADPFLLRRVAGGLFVVEAEWELTALEVELLSTIRTV